MINQFSMKIINSFFIALLFTISFSINTSAQEKDFKINTSPKMEFPRAGTVKMNSIKEDFLPLLRNIEQPKPGGEKYNNYLQKIKAEIQPVENPQIKLNKSGILNSPVKLRNFEGNKFPTGIPNDNDLAISNSGIIVSVVNSNITVLDSNGANLQSVSLAAFSDTLKLKQNKYDPRVLYDPLADRFIIVCLNGNNDSTNFAIIAFAKTSDPTKDWNLYTIPGNPLNDTTWSDYPIIAINKDELFLTLNALENNKSWQEGFVQSYIWQIDKNSGYTGAALKTKLHTGLEFNGRKIRNVCPVQGGTAPTAADCYFLSNRNFSASNDSIFLLKISGTIDAPSSSSGVKLLKSDTKYGVAPEAKQSTVLKLQTNDARILDAFIENGKIQFVGNSRNPATNLAGIFHGTITDMDNTPAVNINILGDVKLDYGYPAIAYAGKSAQDDDAIILVNHSADTVFPGNSVYYAKNGNYSDLLRLKSGLSVINMSGANERWGDYSGAQLRYNQPGKVWVGATFGYTLRKGFETYRTHGTWISEVQAPAEPSSIAEQKNTLAPDTKAFPSPLASYEPLNVEFTLEKITFLSFDVYDMSGKLVRQILHDRAKPGKNLFSFNINALKPGQYILRITDTENKAVVAKAFVVR